MTIQLIQTAQIQNVSSLGCITYNSCGYSYAYHIVINPTLPAIVFSYSIDYQGIDYNAIGIIIGNNAQYIANPSETISATIIATHNPILFFENAVLILASYVTNSNDADYWAYDTPALVYYLQNNTFNFTITLLPTELAYNGLVYGWSDSAVDYQNQYLYLLTLNPNGFIVLLFAIPFSELQTLLTQLQLPQNFLEASLMIPNGCYLIYTSDLYPALCAYGGMDSNPIMIYYDGEFYLFFQSGGEDIYMWTFSLDQITWSNTLPSSTTQTICGASYSYVPSNLQTVGNVVDIMTEAGYTSTYIYGFTASFNYYMSNGSINPEILVPVVLWNYNNPEGWTLAVISVNPSTLNVTAIANIPYNGVNPSLSVYPYLPIYIAGGLLISTAYVSSSSSSSYWYVFVYDRNTGDMAVFPPPNNVILVVPAEGGYVISVTGSCSSATITVYQVVTDAVPVITNLEFVNNTISGTAIDLVSNTPVTNVTVALFELISQGGYNFSGEIIATITTDSNGDFSFQISQPGYYAIRAFT